jgi:uncharacterized SAM-binding protein YcdF (DUF218 family)
MPILLDKLLPLFVYPLGLTIPAGIAALVLSLTGFVRTSRAVLAAGIAVLWIASTPLVSNWLYGSLEAGYPPVAIEELPQSDVAIVLGGAIGRQLSPRLAPDAGEAIDRVLHTARLFHAGKTKAILVSGGNLPWQTASEPEAELIAGLLVELGVPRSAIALETESRNTRQNAVNSAGVMKLKNWRSAVLVTSAAHMPRALAVFEKAGIGVVPASTDVRVTYPLFESVLDLVPSAAALAITTDALKELLGIFVYRMRGWA